MVPLRHCTGEERVKEGRVLDLFLMQVLCSSGPWVRVVENTCWVDVYEAFLDFVEHPQTDLSSSMFQTCPFQIFEHRCCVACQCSCCSRTWLLGVGLFKELGFPLLVRIS